MQITVDRNGQKFGPYNLDEVRQYLADGSLLPTDLVWHDGIEDWIPLSEIADAKPAARSNKTLAIALAVGGIAAFAALVIFVVLPLFGGKNNVAKPATNDTSPSSGNQTASPITVRLPGTGELVLADADLIAQVRPAAILQYPSIAAQIQSSPPTQQQLAEIRLSTGFGPEDIQSITASATGLATPLLTATNYVAQAPAFLSDTTTDFRFLISIQSGKAVDAASLVSILTNSLGVAADSITTFEHAGKTCRQFTFHGRPVAFAFLTSQHLVIGTPATVRATIDEATAPAQWTGTVLLPEDAQAFIGLAPTGNMMGQNLSKNIAARPGSARAQLKEASAGLSAATLSLHLEQGANFRLAGRFTSDEQASRFATAATAVFADLKAIPEIAEPLTALHLMGVTGPEANTTGDITRITLLAPESAITSATSGLFASGHSHESRLRWAGMSQFSQMTEWPRYDYIQTHLGQPDATRANTLIDLRPFNTQPTLRLLNPYLLTSDERRLSRFIGTRIDYHDNPEGTRAIRLYIRPATRQLIAIEWHEPTTDPIGPPGPPLQPPSP